MLCEAHEVYSLFRSEEQIEEYKANYPELLDAYYVLHRLAAGAATVTDSGDGYAADSEP